MTNEKIRKEFHDFYELVYVYRGKGGQYLAGEREPLRMEAGDVCILTPGKIHAMMPSGKNDIILKLILPRTMAKTLASECRRDTGLSDCANMLKSRNELYLFRLAESDDFSISHLMEALMMELYREKGYSAAAARSMMMLLLVGLNRAKMERQGRSFFYTVTDYIQRHIASAELDELAVQMGYSSRHLARRITEETGSTFSDLLTHIRLQRAAELLADTDLIIEEVACQAGYKNSSGLYKRFQAVYGMSPGEYRRLYRS